MEYAMAMTVLPSDENNYLPALSGGKEKIILDEILHCHQGYVGSASLEAYIDHGKHSIVITLYIQLLDHTPYHHVMDVSMESSISIYEIANQFCNIVSNIIVEHIKKKDKVQGPEIYVYGTGEVYKPPSYSDFLKNSYNMTPYSPNDFKFGLWGDTPRGADTVQSFVNPVKALLSEGEKSVRKVKVECPLTTDEECTWLSTHSVYDTIMHLNDLHRMPREDIADWLDELHDAGIVDLRIEIPDSEDKL